MDRMRFLQNLAPRIGHGTAARRQTCPVRLSVVGCVLPMRRLAMLLCAWTLLALIAAGARAGGEYTVDRTDDVVAADTCLDGVPLDCSLRGAIRRANQDKAASVVILPGGTYNLTIEGANEDASTTGDLDVRLDPLVLRALPGAHPIIHQRTGDRVFDLDSSADAVTFEGPLTLREGVADNSGGFIAGGSIYAFRLPRLTLTDVVMEDGVGFDAGGCLYWAASTFQTSALDLERVTVTGCETEVNGGGIYVDVEDATVILDRVVARDNLAAERGGGVFIAGGTTTVTMQDSELAENRTGSSFTSSGDGAGLYLSGGGLFLVRSSVRHNEAGIASTIRSSGGGIAMDNATLRLRNVTLSANRAFGINRLGAELAAASGTVELDFVTVRGHASNDPVAISNGMDASVDFFATVIEGACLNAGGPLVSSGLNVEYSLSGAQASQCQLIHPGDQFVTTPLLRPLAGYGGPTPSHALLDGVATTFVVGSASCPTLDQRSAPRLGLFCHAGSVEDGITPPGPWVFADGFDSGDAAAWSTVVP